MTVRSSLALLGVLAACGVERAPDQAAPCDPLTGPWVESDGRVNGDIRSLAVLDDGTLLAGTIYGIVALDPVTREWGPRIDFSNPVTSLAVDPADPDRVLATSSGIHESRDRGRTWQLLYDYGGIAGEFPGAVAFAPSRPERIHGILADRAVRSDDGGASWSALGQVPLGVTRLVVAAEDPDALYATWVNPWAQEARWSDDGGETWNEAFAVTDVAAGSGTTLFGGTPMTVHRSDDAGRTWTSLPYHDTVQPLAIAVDPGPEEVVYVAGWGRVHASVDGGQTWTEWIDFPPVGWPDTMVVGGDGAVYIGPEWGSAVLELDAGGAEAHWYGGGVSGVGRELVGEVGGLLYVATSDGIFISGHAGITWGTITGGLPLGTDPWFMPLALVAPSDPSVVYVTYWAIDAPMLARSDDGGQSWRDLGTITTPPAIVDPVDPHVLYWLVDGQLAMTEGDAIADRVPIDVGGRGHLVAPDRRQPPALLVAVEDRLIRVADRGASVGELLVPARDLAVPLGGRRVFAVHTARRGDLVISYSDAIARRGEDGAWSLIELEGLEELSAITADPTRPEGLFALSYGRVYRSPDLGDTWCPIDGLGEGDIGQLVALGGIQPVLVASARSRLYRIAIE